MKIKKYEPLVSIVICTYNNKDIIAGCLKSIADLTYNNFKCILVDDHSTDGTYEYVKEKYPWVICVKKKENSGIGTSRNIGIRKSKSKYILFLDSDAELNMNFLNECVKLMESDKNIGICGPKLAYILNSRIICSAGLGLLKICIGYDRGEGNNISKYATQERVLSVCGAAMFVRSKIFKSIGNFDETTSSYGCDDQDFCWRANIAGYKVLYNPKAIGYHGFHQTVKKMNSSKVIFHSTKAPIRMLIKNYSIKNLFKYLPLLFLFSVGDIILFGKSRTSKIKAWVWNITHISDTLKEREHVQKTRKVDDKQIDQYFDKNLMPWVKNIKRKPFKIVFINLISSFGFLKEFFSFKL